MNEEQHTIENLIARVLTDEATSDDRRQLETWMEESDANRRYYRELKTIFDRAATPGNQSFDVDHAWQRLRRKMGAAERRNQGDRLISPGMMWKAAAVIAVFLVAGLFLYRATEKEPGYRIATEAVVLDATLPDGTVVSLNRHSSLLHTSEDQANIHTVVLQGEAFFEIQPEEAKTFLVRAGDVFIRDIGTAFNVNAYPDSSFVEVFVREGEVIVYTETDPGIHLARGETGLYDQRSGRFSVVKADPNVIAYKTRTFVFEDQPLQTIVRNLNAVYDRKITIAKELAGCRLTVSFDHENIDEISAVIAETLGLTIDSTQGDIVLTGEGCE